MKSALTQSYELGFTRRSHAIEWQDWFDCVLMDDDL